MLARYTARAAQRAFPTTAWSPPVCRANVALSVRTNLPTPRALPLVCHPYGGVMDLLRAVPILTVSDVDAAVREYSELLGLDVLMNLGWVATLGTSASAQFSVMDIDQSAPCNPQMSVEVSDVDAAYRQAQDSGAEIVHPLQDEEWGVRRFFLRTSAGHVVNVLSHRS